MASEKVRVRVKPRSRKAPLVEPGDDGILTVHVAARPVEGAANDELLETLAAHLGVRRSRVRVTSGGTARVKTVTVDRD